MSNATLTAQINQAILEAKSPTLTAAYNNLARQNVVFVETSGVSLTDLRTSTGTVSGGKIYINVKQAKELARSHGVSYLSGLAELLAHEIGHAINYASHIAHLYTASDQNSKYYECLRNEGAASAWGYTVAKESAANGSKLQIGVAGSAFSNFSHLPMEFTAH